MQFTHAVLLAKPLACVCADSPADLSRAEVYIAFGLAPGGSVCQGMPAPQLLDLLKCTCRNEIYAGCWLGIVHG